MSDDYQLNQQLLESDSKAKGFFDPVKVKKISFFTIAICVIFAVLFSILAIWDFTDNDVLYRALATLGVVCLGVIIFSIINEHYG